MQKGIRVVIVHGWMGTPTRDWLSWLKKELLKKGIEAQVPKMPNTNRPKIEEWNRYLAKIVKSPDSKLFLVGHSVGGRLLLRYLEDIDTKIGGAVIVASWLNKRRKPFKKKSNAKMMAPWLKTPIKWAKIRKHARKFTAIYSDDDRYVPPEAAQVIKNKLSAKVVLLHNKGHIDQNKSPAILKEVVQMIKRSEKG